MTERAKIPLLFDPHLEARVLSLKASEDLCDRRWGAWFGEIQAALHQSKWKGQALDHCRIDLTACAWADPIPLLSLGIALAQFVQQGHGASLVLPTANDRQKSAQNRLLKFLAKEGFIELFRNIASEQCPPGRISVSGSYVGQGEIEVSEAGPHGPILLSRERLEALGELPADLAFDDSTCLPAQLLYVRSLHRAGSEGVLDDIDRWVERILAGTIEPVVANKVPNWAQAGVKYRLLMFLRETLHNVAEHAYRESAGGFAAVYVRYRNGLLGVAPNVWNSIEHSGEREANNNIVPLLHEEFARSRTGFFEVFVVDTGLGMCRSLGDCPPVDNSDPVHKTLREVFAEGRRSKPLRQQTTQFGGLYLVAQLLMENRDYVRIRDWDTWFGAALPLPEQQYLVHHTLSSEGEQHTGSRVQGLAWTARMSWLEKTDIPGYQQPWRGLGSRREANPFVRECRAGLLDVQCLEGVPVHDDRFAGRQWSNLQECRNGMSEYVLFLPRPKMMKNRVQEEIASLLESGCLKDGGSLIVSDIPSEEAFTYLAAIEGARWFRSKPLSDIVRVVLVTEGLRACVLERRGGLLKRNEDVTMNFVKARGASKFAPVSSLCHLFRLLRHHEGRRLRDEIGLSGNGTGAEGHPMVFVPGPIGWHDRILSSGNLDFPQTLANPVCGEIYFAALRRFTALYPGQHCELRPLDPLVDSLLVRFNAHRHPSPNHNERARVDVGSIRVSGLTEAASNAGNPVVHFFAHPDGEVPGEFLLPWPGPVASRRQELLFPEEPPPGSYRRVGHSAVIARDGWKAYCLPRFTANASPAKQRSIYEQPPRDSYRAWQEPSRTLMKLGHWRYGGHHDLLTVNVMLAFDTEIDRINITVGGSLARYLFKKLMGLFGITEHQLTEAGKRVLKVAETDTYSLLLPDAFHARKPLLIYPSHVVTDHVIDRFLGFISDADVLRDLRGRTIGILPVRRHRTGSGLQISGLILGELQREARRRPKPPVVLFDDALVTGRTYAELKRLLRNTGFKDIYSLAILDRQRLPAADYIASGHKVCYWRLDVPPMGSDGHCPLCVALDKAAALKEALTSQLHRHRIESWQTTWFVRNPATEWGDAGLKPLPLDLKKPERKFAIAPDPRNPLHYIQCGGDHQRIRITNTAGLVAWVTELRSMTSRDDLAARLLKSEDFANSPEVRIQLFASQLLLFFKEADPTLERDLSRDLLRALWDAEDEDRHTALAALTLLAVDEHALGSAMLDLLTPERKAQVKDKNIDFILLLAHRMRSEMIQDEPPLVAASRLLKPAARRGMYFNFHREVKDVQGTAHTPPLHRLCEATEAETFRPRLPSAIASAGQLRALSELIPPY